MVAAAGSACCAYELRGRILKLIEICHLNNLCDPLYRDIPSSINGSDISHYVNHRLVRTSLLRASKQRPHHQHQRPFSCGLARAQSPMTLPLSKLQHQ